MSDEQVWLSLTSRDSLVRPLLPVSYPTNTPVPQAPHLSREVCSGSLSLPHIPHSNHQSRVYSYLLPNQHTGSFHLSREVCTGSLSSSSVLSFNNTHHHHHRRHHYHYPHNNSLACSYLIQPHRFHWFQHLSREVCCTLVRSHISS